MKLIISSVISTPRQLSLRTFPRFYRYFPFVCLEPSLTITHPHTAHQLADFGLAAVTEDLRQGVKVVCGTPGFLAPEMLTSDCYDDKVDIWSLGVVTYMLLSGHPPFEARLVVGSIGLER